MGQCFEGIGSQQRIEPRPQPATREDVDLVEAIRRSLEDINDPYEAKHLSQFEDAHLAEAIHLSQLENDKRIASEVVKHKKAAINHPMGTTALHWAASAGSEDAAKALLDERADVNATNTAGQTPLHFAAQSTSNSIRVIHVLLEHCADVGARASTDKPGVFNTPFELAQASWQYDAAREIRQTMDACRISQSADVGPKPALRPDEEAVDESQDVGPKPAPQPDDKAADLSCLSQSEDVSPKLAPGVDEAQQ